MQNKNNRFEHKPEFNIRLSNERQNKERITTNEIRIKETFYSEHKT